MIQQLRGKRVAVIVAAEVEDLEYFVPVMRLREEAATVTTAAASLNPIRGKGGLEITPDTTFDSLDSAAFDALIIPGGWAPDKMRRSAAVLDLVRALDRERKVIATICHGGWVPISAGIVKGRRATGSAGIRDDLVNAGAIWVDEPAFTEGHLVWGRVVADIPDFCRELVQRLADHP